MNMTLANQQRRVAAQGAVTKLYGMVVMTVMKVTTIALTQPVHALAILLRTSVLSKIKRAARVLKPTGKMGRRNQPIKCAIDRVLLAIR